MVEMTVAEALAATGARLLCGDADRSFAGCCIDSREVREGGMFVAFPGERVDGNRFAPQAVERGAACAVLTREPDEEVRAAACERGCALVVCDDPEAFLLRLAKAYRDRLDCTVVGVTGSVGKTSTKDMLMALVGTTFKVHGTAGNYNNLIGLPLTVLAAPADTQVLVLEMGMNSRGEISALTRVARPTYGIVTKIGTSHIGMLGSRQAIAEAKAEMLEGMPPSSEIAGGRASALFLTAEDDFTPFIEERFARPAGVDVVLCGQAKGTSFRAEDVSLDAEGRPSFTAVLETGERFSARLSLTGAHSVSNALLAIAVASRLGVSAGRMAAALEGMAPSHMRQEQVEAACGARIVDDSYNASPDSCAAALDVLMALPCGGRRIAVLGEIGELGGEAVRLHAMVGSYAAARRPDLLVCVGGEHALAMADAARLMGLAERAVRVVPDSAAAEALVLPGLTADDLVLVKGSRSVGLDSFVKGACSR